MDESERSLQFFEKKINPELRNHAWEIVKMSFTLRKIYFPSPGSETNIHSYPE